jgi:hypothetical protein
MSENFPVGGIEDFDFGYSAEEYDTECWNCGQTQLDHCERCDSCEPDHCPRGSHESPKFVFSTRRPASLVR